MLNQLLRGSNPLDCVRLSSIGSEIELTQIRPFDLVRFPNVRFAMPGVVWLLFSLELMRRQFRYLLDRDLLHFVYFEVKFMVRAYWHGAAF